MINADQLMFKISKLTECSIPDMNE